MYHADFYQQAFPPHRFNIGAQVVNVGEINDAGMPSGCVRFVRESHYSTARQTWLYQLQKDQGWVEEDALRRAPKDGL